MPITINVREHRRGNKNIGQSSKKLATFGTQDSARRQTKQKKTKNTPLYAKKHK